MKHDFPANVRRTPNCRAQRYAPWLVQYVRDEIEHVTQYSYREISTWPIMRLWTRSIPLQRSLDGIITAINSAACADLPKGLIKHAFKIFARRAVFSPMKYRFASGKFRQNLVARGVLHLASMPHTDALSKLHSPSNVGPPYPAAFSFSRRSLQASSARSMINPGAR